MLVLRLSGVVGQDYRSQGKAPEARSKRRQEFSLSKLREEDDRQWPTATLQSWIEPWGHCSSLYTRPQEGTGCARLGCGFNLGRFQPGGGEEMVWGSEGMRNKIEPWC